MPDISFLWPLIAAALAWTVAGYRSREHRSPVGPFLVMGLGLLTFLLEVAEMVTR